MLTVTNKSGFTVVKKQPLFFTVTMVWRSNGRNVEVLKCLKTDRTKQPTKGNNAQK